MSTWYAAAVQCPSCGHRFEARLVRGANVARAPALREAAMNGTLNRPACPACGRRHETDAELVYADPERGHWISVARRADLARWAEVERATLAAFHTTLETAAAEAFVATHVRVVFDLDELRERLEIWAAGFDDGVVECIKLRCLRERPSMRESGDRIRVSRIQPSLALRLIDSAGGTHGEIEVSRTAVEQATTDTALGAEFPELFAPGFVSIDRYLR